MFPVFDIGPFAVQAPGLILILSGWIGLWLTSRLATSLGTNGNKIENSVLLGVISGILGARLGFMLQNPAVFLSNPLNSLSLTPTMLDPTFGILIGCLTAAIYIQRHHLPALPSLDTLGPLIVLVFAGMHLANFAEGTVYGLPTEMPWGIHLWNETRHPVQIYVILLTCLVFGWLLIKTQRFSTTGFIHSGTLFLVTLSALSIITIITRAFVAEKDVYFRFDLLQIFSFFVLGGSLAWIYFINYTKDGPGNKALICLGSNFNPWENLSKAIETLKHHFTVLNLSSPYQTEDINQNISTPDFLNQVIEIRTSLDFPEFYKKVKSIENQFGRHPDEKQQVTLDIDILTFNRDVFFFNEKQIPDPNLTKHTYIAIPIKEICPKFRHPATGKSINEILDEIDQQQLKVEQVKEEVHNGITG